MLAFHHAEGPQSNIQAAFRALADPTRRAILQLLSRRDMTIAEVAGHFEMTRAAVKKHLVILEQGRLISVHPTGRERINRLEAGALKPAHDWLSGFDRFWDDRLTRLADAVGQHEASNPTSTKEDHDR